ncbi:hypothetical protein [Saccharopolyspora pogona]|nr:hypothetical protein [Saccharopolyspora pogona]
MSPVALTMLFGRRRNGAARDLRDRRRPAAHRARPGVSRGRRDATGQQHVETPPDLWWTWLRRDGAAAGRSQGLIDAVQGLEMPAGVDVSA